MRLALILDHFQEERGGAERYLSSLSRRLVARNHEMDIFCMDGQAPDDRIRMHRVEVDGISRGSRERRFAERAVRMAESENCDLIFAIRHCCRADLYQPHGGTWAATDAARLHSKPFSLPSRWLRRCSPKHRYFQFADEEIFRANPRMLTLAVSEWVREDILRRYGRHRPDVRVLWPAVDVHERLETATDRLQIRAQWFGADDGPILLFVAHQFEAKGLGELLLAMRLVRDPSVKLVVVGRGHVDSWRRTAERHDLGQRVRFEGAVSRMEEVYRAADLVVHPTRYDPCALVTLEAMACGRRVVTTDCNGASYWVERGRGTVLASPWSVRDLQAAIDAELQASPTPDETTRELRDELNWSRHCDRFEGFLQEALERRSAS